MLRVIDLQLFITDMVQAVCGYDTTRCTLKEQAGLSHVYLLACAAVTNRCEKPSLANI